MAGVLQKAVLGVALGGTFLIAVAPSAEAQRWRHYHRYRGGDGGTAVVAGIAGLAIGAALASNNDRRYDRGYYDRDYYDRGYYPRQDYYYRDYPPRRYREDCYVRREWDPYEGRRVIVRYCD